MVRDRIILTWYSLFLLLTTLVFGSVTAHAATGTIRGTIISSDDNTPVKEARVELLPAKTIKRSNAQGKFEFTGLEYGKYILRVSKIGFRPKSDTILLQKEVLELSIVLNSIVFQGEEAVVTGEHNEGDAIDYLPPVQGTAIYEGKKNEVIRIGNIDANLATNNSRQIFSRVPGVNIIENDGGGVQLGLGVRGLNPNRITEFNSRQNGYDISADALGYPESYYTPPSEAVERVEVVRGAASLQYGSQFGGLLNFIMKEGPSDKPFEVQSHQTLASYGFFNSYNSIGGTTGDFSYYGAYHLKRGNGYRQNSGYNVQTMFAQAAYNVTENFRIKAELTNMNFDMQQPGGLTDAQYKADPRQATKFRNWLSAHWFLPAVHIDYKITPFSKINLRTFALIANRSSVGNLTPPSQGDTKINRTLSVDNYNNIGSELRFLQTYSIGSELATLLVGARYYRGNTHRQQGFGTPDSSANYNFIHPDDLEGSDYHFPSTNIALFAENILNITPSLSVTPGVRWESITTVAEGYYKADINRIDEKKESSRNFPLFGIGVMYRLPNETQLYFNISQAYSPVNFNDIRVVNPNFKVDPDLKDVTGFNADLGYRGKLWDKITFDLSAFYLAYNDRIGVLTQADSNFNIYRYRTNISDSRSLGLELFAESELPQLFLPEQSTTTLFVSAGITDAEYINSAYKGISGNKVEYAPDLILRSGLTYKQGPFSSTLQASYSSDQYTDATNTKQTFTGINGIIPAYWVADLSANYEIGIFNIGAGINNLFDKIYFTRRADGYPGPGILPADGRSFYLTAGVKI